MGENKVIQGWEAMEHICILREIQEKRVEVKEGKEGGEDGQEGRDRDRDRKGQVAKERERNNEERLYKKFDCQEMQREVEKDGYESEI